jgi:tetratricopeptide (TPR) repeat protein
VGRGAAWLVTVMISSALVRSAATDARQSLPSADELATGYLLGDRESVLAQVAAMPGRCRTDTAFRTSVRKPEPDGCAPAARSFDRVRGDIERRAETWATADPRWGTNARLAVATFLLDIAHARLESNWLDVRSLVELGCRLTRAVNDDVALLRQWHLAALALAEGAADTRLLVSADDRSDVETFEHLAHSRSRFPAEPRFRLAEVFVPQMGLTDLAPPRDQPLRSDDELRGTPVGGLMELRMRRDRRRAAESLASLLDVPAVAAEVHLRIGYLDYQLNEDAAALAHWQAALSSSTDPFVTYVTHLLTGVLNQRRGDRAAAETSLRRALNEVPGAQSATEILAAQLFIDRRVDESYDLVDAMFANRPLVTDPWRLFGYGDFRSFPNLVAQLRHGALP